VKDPRKNCKFRERCGRTGHYLEKGVYKRCDCLIEETTRKQLGVMFIKNIAEVTNLEEKKYINLVLEGGLASLRPHVGRVLLNMIDERETFHIMDVYRLVEIYLEKDDEFATVSAAINTDLLIILLGYGDPPNRYLPELLNQAINRRELLQRPTWIVLGLDLGQVASRYNTELYEKIKKFEKAVIR